MRYRQLLLDLSGCQADLDNIQLVTSILDKTCQLLEVNAIKKFSHSYSPFGLSVVYVLAESHISYHSWPEHKTCNIDIFSCGRTGPEKIVKFLYESFQATGKREKYSERNVTEPIAVKE